MALWEYKIIGSGKGGFGSPSLLESHLNQLGKDEWEIIAFVTNPENPLAFQGLARRTTLRDWTLQDAAAAAAKAEAEKLRAEFAAKFQAAQAPAIDEKPTSLVREAAAPEDGLRRLRDTDRDQDPEALADAEDGEEFPLDSEDELPTFFEFIRPHMRRNQRGPGLSLAVDYLANKIDQAPSDIVSALRECGFVIPDREDDDPVYLEYDGDLFWINVNRHHQLFINTKEKPRPVFRAVKGQPFVAPEKPEEAAQSGEGREARESRQGRESRHRKGKEEKVREPSAPPSDEANGETATAADEAGDNREAGEASAPRQERERDRERAPRQERPQANGTPAVPNAVALPGGEELLAKLRPMMRRNRRGPGVSGSVGFLSRALNQSDAELAAALAAVGFPIPERPNDKPGYVDVGTWTFWINKDNRGGLWINGREKRARDGKGRGEALEAADAPASAEGTAAAAAEVPGGQEPAVATASEALTPGQPPAEAPVGPVAAPDDTTATVPAASLATAPGEAPSIATVAERAGEESPLASDTLERGQSAAPLTETGPLAPVRLLLKAKPRSTTATGEIEALARALNTTPHALLETLSDQGLAAPGEGTAKGGTIEWGGETLWISRNEKDGSLSLNAKTGKTARKPRASTGGSRRTSKKTSKTNEDHAASS